MRWDQAVDNRGLAVGGAGSTHCAEAESNLGHRMKGDHAHARIPPEDIPTLLYLAGDETIDFVCLLLRYCEFNLTNETNA